MTSKMPNALGLWHTALRVLDLEQCEAFYADVLGFVVEWRPDPENVYMRRGRDNLAIHRVDQVERPGALDHLGLLVETPEDVDQWFEWIQARGMTAKVLPRTHRDGARSFYLDDPEGNTVQIIYHPPISNP